MKIFPFRFEKLLEILDYEAVYTR